MEKDIAWTIQLELGALLVGLQASPQRNKLGLKLFVQQRKQVQRPQVLWKMKWDQEFYVCKEDWERSDYPRHCEYVYNYIEGPFSLDLRNFTISK